jgi:hypothetical protein
MNKIDFPVSNLELAHWATAIRNIPDHSQRTRALDALWWGQLASKGWLVNHLTDYIMEGAPTNIYIFGGWIGILGSMLLQSTINVQKCRSIDLDPWCEAIADQVNKNYEMDDWRFKAITADMSTYQYQSDIRPTVVINTSTEHVTQPIYDQWYNNIPRGTLIVAQGNNFFSCDEHIRCSTNLQEFLQQNKVENAYYTGELPTTEYTRYMAIWRKQ